MGNRERDFHTGSVLLFNRVEIVLMLAKDKGRGKLEGMLRERTREVNAGILR